MRGTAQSWSRTASLVRYLDRRAQEDFNLRISVTIQNFEVCEVQTDIVNPKHGVVLTYPSLQVHVQVHHAGVVGVRDVAADNALKLPEL